MDKRYQVFVSSTYVDLQEERQRVLQTLMEMDCIPAGMELFPATDEEQWEFIKRIIDDCDYYLLIIGGRYGSVADDGLSYTEKEFDYAVSKGIKVIALLHNAPDELPRSKSETEEIKYQKLQNFREKVSHGRLVRFWNDASQLPGEVSLSLNKTMKMFPAIGWVRADSTASPELLAELNEIRKENDSLKAKINKMEEGATLIPSSELADFDSCIEIHGQYSLYAQSFSENTRYVNWSNTASWAELFGVLSPFLASEPFETSINEFLASHYSGIDENNYDITSPEVDTQIFFTIRVQLMALNLICVLNDSNGTRWQLTDMGVKKMLETRVVRNDS
ncbi:DUF4062 domain-containing protein [Vibrio parahaemolyticus]|uniref:DUF4062 domain-containing protein n=1 Tax=Vibrio parahaemolyticus TaxID=670 RepID=UPI001FADC46E|nr:DUF4062 domain-containing protein [Vibrio parahaemolyticus]MCI9690675.1 DUF4062 domain-containing protein [Vibrio parahaemolyticus]